ncbi:uncharacterized protein KQ657_004426 [Scheffersomyces spartinae]|uniref:DSC E3 ubiquitin ligase complex subunit 3 C-terminal domain-containing protein n=1 Tax=Scheffersomyces spartinae TaxID=45513 RepID=A0A9P8AK38_9ASCO|nr:uncharacterized protein KQ657_004426 [Scheffersomyces spartinae]KAG7194747.1 hypothetical protein KQ657_004426 [Scheffersomyces spartinae]
MQFTIIVRFTNTSASSSSLADLRIPISIGAERNQINGLITTSFLRLNIRNKYNQCCNRRLKLIYSGRILNHKTDFYKEVFEPVKRVWEQEDAEIEDGSGLNNADLKTSGDHILGGSIDQKSKEVDRNIYIHCVVGDELSRTELEQEERLDNETQIQTTSDSIGFDRLLLQGFSEDDVRDFRRQFQMLYGNNNNTLIDHGGIADLEEQEQRLSEMRQLENRLVENMFSTGVAENTGSGSGSGSGSSAGTGNQLETDDTDPTTPNVAPSLDLEENANEDLLLGVLLGIFLGAVALLFLLIDDSIFNKRQKMAIVFGLIMNFMFSVVRGNWI